MSLPTTLGIHELFRLLGVKGGSLPELNMGAYTPVIQMADFSQSLTSEPIEARGIAGAVVNALAGGFATAELRCASPGGLVVDEIFGAFAGFIGNFRLLRSQAQVLPFAPQIDYMSAGGTPAQSLFDARNLFTDITTLPGESTLFPGVGVYLGASSTTQFSLRGGRIFVPPGNSLVFQASLAGSGDAFCMGFLWRELAQGIGTP